MLSRKGQKKENPSNPRLQTAVHSMCSWATLKSPPGTLLVALIGNVIVIAESWVWGVFVRFTI